MSCYEYKLSGTIFFLAIYAHPFLLLLSKPSLDLPDGMFDKMHGDI